ncbi:two-component system, OmpR family, response regulator TctD [Aliiroseovarius sediminilitoris]|uniref:Two-component system, OmpR family, response regulator TctD n=1 Tax=Aliiroseovarius sediminilitoris TaxID=1173584 RepID=A0A1I0N2P1_9RHOB|nr:response regulator transcription factor [Aliiroseovarius sediminilitoris]SEV94618.1 two-component system, OmpR family, response regulator TctD [Aliiroseovarius sediminilitoris]
MRFLLIEDNPKLAGVVVERLQLDGHAVDHAGTLSDATDLTAVADYDLILLDIMLPDGDGRDFLERQRQAERRTPVIVITARSSVSDRVGLLDLGADDYIVKPFDFSELEARVRAVLRRQGGAADNTTTFEETTLDSTKGELRFDGQTVSLRNRELRLLEVFFAAPGQVFSKTHLIDRLFSLSDEASENAIEVYVGRLRKRLEGSGAKIETVRGMGYRMVAR